MNFEPDDRVTDTAQQALTAFRKGRPDDAPAIPPIAERLRLLTEDQAAELLGLHVQTLRRWRRARTGPRAVILGARRYGYRLGDIEAWQDARRAA